MAEPTGPHYDGLLLQLRFFKLGLQKMIVRAINESEPEERGTLISALGWDEETDLQKASVLFYFANAK